MKVEMLTESKSLLDSIDSTKQIDDKLMRPVIKWMKQMLDAMFISSMRWVDMTVCVAHILTKTSAPLTDDVMNVFKTGIMIDLKKTKNRL